MFKDKDKVNGNVEQSTNENGANANNDASGTNNRLDGFLNPKHVEQTKEVIVSDKYPAFVIKTITQKENNAIIKSCIRTIKEDGSTYDLFDKPAYQAKLLLACVVDPDCTLEVICKKYGTNDPAEVLSIMLNMGEYANLVKKVMELNGFKTIEDITKAAKNL